MNCLLDKERVIKYPCSSNCHLFGDCLVEFEKQLQNEKIYLEKEALRIAYEKSCQKNNHVVKGASAIHAQEHRHILHILDKQPAADVVAVVRCKDCKHRIDDKDFVRGHFCVKRPSNGGYFCEDNDFCSYGERKIDNGHS